MLSKYILGRVRRASVLRYLVFRGWFFPLVIILLSMIVWKTTYFFKFILFYSSIVDLQHFVNFCLTAQWFSYTYTCILFHILFHYGPSQNIEYSSLCYSRTLLLIHSIYNSLHLLISNSHHIPPSPCLLPWQLWVYSLCLWVCFCFTDNFIFCHILDSAHKWYHVVFVFLTYYTY